LMIAFLSTLPTAVAGRLDIGAIRSAGVGCDAASIEIAVQLGQPSQRAHRGSPSATSMRCD
jgi:hypothetical protein